jgi:hypothetical protein
MSNESENKEENDDQYIKDMLEEQYKKKPCQGCGGKLGCRGGWRGCPDE